jgi:hypothetical protein
MLLDYEHTTYRFSAPRTYTGTNPLSRAGLWDENFLRGVPR